MIPRTPSILVTTVLAAGCGASPSANRSSAALKAPAAPWTRTPPPNAAPAPLPKRAPRVTERRLANGLRVIFVEHHRRPTVNIRLVFGQGAAQDFNEGIGATFFAVSLLGGFYEVDQDERRIVETDSFARKVFYSGGELKIAVSADQAYIGIDGYAKDTPTYLKLLSGAIRKPRCGPNSFALRRTAMINALEEVELSDAPVFQLFVDRAAFGAGHPYARPSFGSIRSLKELSLLQIRERQQRLLTPAGSTLLVVGDVDPGTVLPAIQTTLGRWKRRPPTRGRRLPPPRVARGEVLLVPRTPAASMLVCATRPLRSNDGRDRAALQVLAQLLGGGLDSRLGGGLRMQAGVSYSFNATLLERRHARALVACTLVRSKDTAKALQIFRRELEALASAPPTADELARAKRQIIVATEVQDHSAAGATMAWLTALELGARTPRADRSVQAVTAEQVHAIARRVLNTGQVRFLLGGAPNYAQQAARMAGLGAVRTVRLNL